ncbi:MAG: zinc ABC transporter substrate-binding protein [Roseovarius sp.]|jgi:zinc transport system substrate-binding protein|uniref:zinc ABC transporter substrate-binding protein n=1 Tax=Roseovarius sp. TaxID=1486281 RepID=UPI0032ECB25F
MSLRVIAALSAGLGFAGAAQAEAPKVVADITPVHSLVAQVMEGAGTPDLLIAPGASPHGYAMRPSEAAALEAADLVFWIGEGLTPWLEGSIASLAEDAHVIALLGAGETRVLPFREGIAFDEHGDHDLGHDDHAHDDHGHDDHGHAHDGADPHAWLDPANARIWLDVIADELAEHDPENAALYKANSAAVQAEIAALQADIAKQIAPLRDVPFLVFHDAYQYFEARFDIAAAGAIALGDAADPGPARVAALRDMSEELDIVCVFSEPQFDPKLVRTVFGDDVGHGVLDPLASDVAPGPSLYPEILRGMARALTGCLGPQD